MSEEDVKVLAYDHLAGSCDCYGDDPCESCQEFVEAFSIGYRAGCADMKKELLGKAHGAYASISPNGYLNDLAMSRQSIEYRMTRIQASDFDKHEEMVIAIETERNAMLAEGWQIILVKIIEVEE